MKGIYLITGTSRGIGLAVAARLLDAGHGVFGVARSASPLAGREGFHPVQASVTEPDWVDPVFDQIKGLLDAGGVDLLCLFNNAAVVDPLLAIETCDADAIQNHVDVNLTAPMQLTARFMAAFAGLALRKKVVNMTSGAAHVPFPDMALYCATKAGISMFTACVGKEQAGKAGGFEVAAISPGMVETGMQELARGMDPAAFRPSDMFRSAKTEGAVRDVDSAARVIVEMLEARTEMGGTVSVSEWA